MVMTGDVRKGQTDKDKSEQLGNCQDRSGHDMSCQALNNARAGGGGNDLPSSENRVSLQPNI